MNKKEMLTTEISVKDTKINILRVGETNYISLTDLAKYANDKEPSDVVRN